MIRIRKASDRGLTKTAWLDSRHSFSFGDYSHPEYTGFRALRVINEDRIGAGAGVPMHQHEQVEILTYVLEGRLEHRDSLGTGAVIGPGDMQRLTTGPGVARAMWNYSGVEPVHVLEVWLEPNETTLVPAYDQRSFPLERGLRVVASGDGRDGSLLVHQDCAIYLGRLGRDDRQVQALGAQRHGWVQVTRGAVQLNGLELACGDGAALSDEPEVSLVPHSQSAELLLFELA